jgi:protein TonB
MAYLQHNRWQDRPKAIAAVIAIHAGIGYVLINGLTYVREVIVDPPLIGETIDEIPLDPPPPPKEHRKTETIPERPTVAPVPPLDLSDRRPLIDTTPIDPPPLPDLPRVFPSPTPPVDLGPRKPAFDPVAPRPLGSPSAWVATSDYRTSWINREWTGTARVRLEVSAAGRVETCTVIGSSGHAELDRATCDLITRRARFEAARDSTGAKTTGSYASSVRWELPR